MRIFMYVYVKSVCVLLLLILYSGFMNFILHEKEALSISPKGKVLVIYKLKKTGFAELLSLSRQTQGQSRSPW